MSSTTDDNYKTFALATCEVIWIQYQLQELAICLTSTPTLCCDNVGVSYLATNHVNISHVKQAPWITTSQRLCSCKISQTSLSFPIRINQLTFSPNLFHQLLYIHFDQASLYVPFNSDHKGLLNLDHYPFCYKKLDIKVYIQGWAMLHGL